MQGELIKEPNIMKQLIHYTNIYYEQIYTMNKNPWHFPVMQGELIFQGMPEKTIFFRKILWNFFSGVLAVPGDDYIKRKLIFREDYLLKGGSCPD
jgi:hypothetical protein